MSYNYKNEKFNNIWELAYWIYCEEHSIDLKRNKTPRKLSNGEFIYFNFISDGHFIDIKPDYFKSIENWPLILEAYVRYGVTVLSHKDLNYAFTYIYKKYGKSYLKRFKDKQEKDFKRKVIEYDALSQEQFIKQKHKNIKFHYICKKCGRDVYTTWNLISHFNDHLCKHCRKSQLQRVTTN